MRRIRFATLASPVIHFQCSSKFDHHSFFPPFLLLFPFTLFKSKAASKIIAKQHCQYELSAYVCLPFNLSFSLEIDIILKKLFAFQRNHWTLDWRASGHCPLLLSPYALWRWTVPVFALLWSTQTVLTASISNTITSAKLIFYFWYAHKILQSKQLGIISASPFAMGLFNLSAPIPYWHPAPKEIQDACQLAAQLAQVLKSVCVYVLIVDQLLDPLLIPIPLNRVIKLKWLLLLLFYLFCVRVKGTASTAWRWRTRSPRRALPPI